MIFDRIMLPAQGRNEDYKFAQTGSVALVASVGGAGGIEPTQSWLENVIKLDPESGFLSVDDWHVKGDLIIEGQVNQWLAQQLVVDDARIQVNRRQDGAVVDSGLVIFDKDTSSEVSSLVYDVNGVWKAGGDRLFTEAYNPKLGGYAAGDYPRKAENAVITGAWTFNNDLRLSGGTTRNLYTGSMRIRDTGTGAWIISPETGAPGRWYFRPDGDAESTNTFFIGQVGVGFGTASPQERLHVVGNGLFTGNLTVGGNVGTSDFVSQMQGWRVTPQGQADFRHIYTDELQAKAFTADISQALVGSDVLTKSVAKLAQNFKIGANNTYAYLYVEELEGYPGMSVFSKWDKLRLRVFDRTGGGLVIADVWVTVTDHDINDTVNNVQRYSVRFDDDGGVVGLDVYAGSMVLDYGQSGSGVIERTVLDPQGSPYSRVSTWTGSPDNPANYTLHYQSGNLNGIPNAEGWGVYSENSFLTGKLLVGDLTKAGQYMEYKDGQLNVKGQITVTGGNAATKEDVDAIQVGGRNLILNSSFVRGYDNWGTTGGGGSHTIATGASDYPSMSPVKRSAKWTNTADAGQGIVASTTDSWPLFENGKEYVITCWVKASSASTFSLQVYGDSGDVANSFKAFSVNTNWQKIVHIVTGDGQSNPRVRFFGRNNGVTYWVNCPKVEIGNKATDWTPAPEDVDATIDNIEVGGRNLVEKTNQGITNLYIDSSAGGATWTRSEEIVDGVRCAKGTKNTTAVETWALFNLWTYTPWKFRANQQYAISFKMKPSFAINNQVTKLTTNTNQALSTNSDTYSLVAGEWNHVKLVVTTLPDFDTILAGRSTVHLRLNIIGNSSTGDTVLLKDIKIEEGNKATDWTPAPEDVPSALDYLATAIQDGSTDIEGGLINTNVLMVKDTAGDVVGGMSGLKSDNVGFWTGGTYQDAINDNANVIFRKDGSFSLAGGKISGTSDGALSVDAGVITGVIESSNYDGTVGSRFDLYNGHLLIGNAIRMSGDVSEIQVRNRDTGLDSFKIGDFQLTPKSFVGEGLDVLLGSGSVTGSAASGSFSLSVTAYVSGTGNLSTSSLQRISDSLIIGGLYNFQTKFKITLSPYVQLGTEPGIISERFEFLSGPGIKMQLKNGNTVVWEQSIHTIPTNGVIPLSISTSFQAVSSSLQLMMSINGEYRYRVPSSTNTRHYNVSASISRFDSSSRLVLQALINRMEFSTKGMQTVFSSSNYFRCDSTGIEGRGVQTFISPDGRYRLRISNAGIQKSSDFGSNWTTI